jgi:hypothetical protein
MYFNTNEPYHWKLKDFHYRYYETQLDSFTNINFGKLTYQDFGHGIKCTANGGIEIANSNAYGIWEFQIINPVGNSYILLTVDGKVATFNFNGYYFVLANNESFSFYRRNGTGATALFTTNTGYFQLDTNYMLKVVRNSVLDEYVTGAVGTFGVYIKGGAIGNSYVLVDLTGGSGSNPVTDNTYTASDAFGLEGTIGDELRDLYINDTLQNFSDSASVSSYFIRDNLKSSVELLIYPTEQTGTKLTNIKEYINLTPGTSNYINE